MTKLTTFHDENGAFFLGLDAVAAIDDNYPGPGSRVTRTDGTTLIVEDVSPADLHERMSQRRAIPGRIAALGEPRDDIG